MNTRNRPIRTALASIATLCLALADTHGQRTASSPPDTDDDIVELSPFTVDAADDSGYRATNSISGTRLNAPIKDIPLNLEVITGEFVRDTGATNLREALRYSPGVVLESQFDGLSAALTTVDSPDNAQANNPESATRNQSRSTVKIRGFITDQTLRDGFRRQHATDTVNISRIEVLRGPSALLYGVGNFGGVVNYLPKRPGERRKTSVSASIGSHGFYRSELDLTLGRIWSSGDASANFGLTAAWQKNGDHTQYYDHDHWFLSPVLVYKPFKDTTLTIEAEFGDSRDEGIGFQSVRSSVIGDGGFPYQTNARRLDFYTPAGADPRTFRWSGPDTWRENPAQNYIVDLQQKLGENFWLKAGVGFSRVEFDSANIWYGTFNKLDPFNRDAAGNVTGVNGGNILPAQLPRYYRTPTTAAQTQYFADLQTALAQGGNAWVDVFNARPANFWYGDIYGSTFTSRSLLASQSTATSYNTVLNYQWAVSESVDERRQARVELNYGFEKFGSHNFLLGMQYMKSEIERTNIGQSPDQASGAPVSSDPAVWNYKSPNDTSPIRFGFQGDGVTPSVASRPVSWNLNLGWDVGYYLVYQGKFLDDRLTIIGGARWDRTDTRGFARRLWLDNPPLEITDRNNPDNLYGQLDAPSEISPQFGVSFALTKNLTAYGLYSTGLLPNANGTLDGNGRQFDPVTAKNTEVGIKFDLFEGRVSGSVSAFKIERENIARNIWWAPAPGVPAALSGHLEGYDTSKPTTIGFYSWGGLNPYYAWHASRSDLNASTPWATIYPAMAEILRVIPRDPVRTWGGSALPLGAADVWSTPDSQAVDAAGNPIAGKTVGQLWTEHLQANGIPLPSIPGDASANPFMVTGASDPWNAAWVSTYGIMVSDASKGEVAPQQLYDMLWAMNAASLQSALGPNGRDPNAQVHAWGWPIPWLWAGNGDQLPYYPGYWNNPNAAPAPGAAGQYTGTINSILGMNSAKVPFRDESKGFEIQLNMMPIDNWQIVLGYAHLVNRNTTATLPYVALDDPTGNARYGLWAAPGESWGTTYFTREQAFDDPDNPATYKIAPHDYGLSLDDTPEDTVTFWTKYSFTTGKLAGLGLGFGGTWESERLFDASVAVDGTVSGTFDPDALKVIADQLYTKSRTRLSALVEYQTVLRDRYRARFALNVDNLADDTDRYGYIYAPGRTWRLSTSIDF
ncbi:hypothetical protein ASA1KI_13670 [Opitutales bacterium ASA1]|uniref:TonB-dependent receptor domain-containing protein n=1 Tax=Congregicoccus parvus TaxID=3081749 RepID=UPI002B2B5E75|nr:hypothetical protein ASA1KI_13670 [Opitutales bacterium ASA1]